MLRKLLNSFALILFGICCSCSDKIGDIKMDRLGYLYFNVDDRQWKASTFGLSEGPAVVKYVDNPAAGYVYYQYTIIAQGINPDGLNFQLSLIFDIRTKEKFIGKYNIKYTVEQGGFDEIVLNQETSPNSGLYNDFQFCAAPDPLATMEISNQNEVERIVRGTFSGKLCTTGNSGKKVTISNGVFEDIPY